MSIYYIEDKNGDFFSTDRKRRFIRLSGQAAYSYLRSQEGRTKRFYKTSTEEDGGEKVFVEIPQNKIHSARKGERRKQYVDDCEKESGISTVSLYSIENGDDELTGEDIVSDPNENVEETVIKGLDIELLYQALHTLTEEEFALINMLFLSPNPMSETKLSEVLGVTQQMISKRKKSIFKKLKNIFKIWL